MTIEYLGDRPGGIGIQEKKVQEVTVNYRGKGRTDKLAGRRGGKRGATGRNRRRETGCSKWVCTLWVLCGKEQGNQKEKTQLFTTPYHARARVTKRRVKEGGGGEVFWERGIRESQPGRGTTGKTKTGKGKNQRKKGK